MSLSKTNLREKEFHNKLHSSGEERSENKFYKAISNLYEDFLLYLKNNTPNRKVLDYGCGKGIFAEKVTTFNPSKLTAIDISETAIGIAKNKSKNKINFFVENCESTNFNSESFDIVYGVGILHHLNLQKAVNEIQRLLKKEGSLIFIEPLGTNPFINFYRLLTPNSRSKDEHPLTFKDIKYLKSLFGKVEINYYGFLTLLFLPLYKLPKESRLFYLLSRVDKIIFKIPFLRFLAWSVLIEAKKN
jgi:SAM-dependent methyltransferase|tara:strand:- start:15228 stop:15962 length:735 start_codon:yes stop_codon:yes gene_type:complete